MIPIRFIAIILIALTSILPAEESINEEFLKQYTKIQEQYRKGLSELLLKADKVQLSIVRFDKAEIGVLDEEKSVWTSGEKRTPIITSKMLTKQQVQEVISTFSKHLRSITKEDISAIDCHYPIHGLKIWKGDKLIYEGTFCWVCLNFMLKYPVGSDDINSNQDLKKLFNNLLPIPKKEMERFKKKYPKIK